MKIIYNKNIKLSWWNARLQRPNKWEHQSIFKINCGKPKEPVLCKIACIPWQRRKGLYDFVFRFSRTCVPSFQQIWSTYWTSDCVMIEIQTCREKKDERESSFLKLNFLMCTFLMVFIQFATYILSYYMKKYIYAGLLNVKCNNKKIDLKMVKRKQSTK